MHYYTKQAFTFFGVSLESLTFFGVRMEYFGAFQELSINLRSFHFGDTMEFSSG